MRRAVILLALLLLAAEFPAEPRPGCPRLHASEHDHARDAAHRASCGLRAVGVVEVSKEAGLGSIEVHGKVATVLQRDEGIVALVDISDPAHPSVLGRFDDGASLSLDGDLAFSADGRYLFYARQTEQFSRDGLHVLDVSDPRAPTEVNYTPGGGMLRVATHFDGDTQWVVTLDAVDGLVVNRFDPPTEAVIPVHIAPLEPLSVGGPGSAGIFIDKRDPMLDVPLLYVASGRGGVGVHVFDFSNPAAPLELGSYQDSGFADLEVSATKHHRLIYAAVDYWFEPRSSPGIGILDATDLSDIKFARGLTLGVPSHDLWRVQGIELVDGRLYAAHSHAGIVGFDPPRTVGAVFGYGASPNRESRIQPPASPYAMDVESARGLLLVSDASTGYLTILKAK